MVFETRQKGDIYFRRKKQMIPTAIVPKQNKSARCTIRASSIEDCLHDLVCVGGGAFADVVAYRD